MLRDAVMPDVALLLERLDPEVREAIHDVDRSLIRWSLSLSPRDRLRSASRMMQTLTRFRRAAPPDRR